MWPLVLVASAGCWCEKALGLLIPQRWLAGARRRAGLLALPVALLAALIVVGTVADGRGLVLDARVPGLAVAIVLALRRASLLVVLLGAVVTTALVRASVGG